MLPLGYKWGWHIACLGTIEEIQFRLLRKEAKCFEKNFLSPLGRARADRRGMRGGAEARRYSEQRFLKKVREGRKETRNLASAGRETRVRGRRWQKKGTVKPFTREESVTGNLKRKGHRNQAAFTFMKNRNVIGEMDVKDYSIETCD